MQYFLSDEQKTIKELARRIAEERIRPVRAELDESEEFPWGIIHEIAAAEGYTIKASELGKTKMVAQVAAVSLVMLSMHWKGLRPASVAGLWLVVFFSLASAVDYVRKFWRGIDEKVKLRRRRELLRLDRRKKREARLLARARRAPADAAPTLARLGADL